ncbi:hypothetical protein OAN94_08405 [Verrucomicrobiales bacterium]|nr:hypothetical protein [Verrucomicrobiales bacterium]
MLSIRQLILIPLPLFVTLLSSARAQIEVRLEAESRTYVANSAVNVKVRVINRAAKAVTLRGPSPATSWLNFRITNSKGDLVTSRPGAPSAKPLNIGASKSVTVRVNLNQAYPVDRFGNYQVTANVYDPSADRYLSSAPQMVTIDEAKAIWQRTAGLSDGSKYEYSLLVHRGQDKTGLYYRMKDANTGYIKKTYRLGEMVRYRPPQAAIDAQRELHVLYLGAPRQYIYDRIGSDGKFIKRKLISEEKGSRPDLLQGRDGHVRVEGGVDPKEKGREKRRQLEDLARIRRSSARPPGF